MSQDLVANPIVDFHLIQVHRLIKKCKTYNRVEVPWYLLYVTFNEIGIDVKLAGLLSKKIDTMSE